MIVSKVLMITLLTSSLMIQGVAQEDSLQITLQKTLLSRKPDSEGRNVKVWTVKQTDIIRINLVEMTGELGLHKHPDASHSLLIVEGILKVKAGETETILNAGDFISFPADQPHKYWPISKRVLAMSVDAPYYDPKKTIRLE